MKEAHVNVASEDIDVAEGGVLHTGDGAAIVHELPDVVPARPHPRKPRTRKTTQLLRLRAQPNVDGGIALYRTGEAHACARGLVVPLHGPPIRLAEQDARHLMPGP